MSTVVFEGVFVFRFFKVCLFLCSWGLLRKVDVSLVFTGFQVLGVFSKR